MGFVFENRVTEKPFEISNPKGICGCYVVGSLFLSLTREIIILETIRK